MSYNLCNKCRSRTCPLQFFMSIVNKWHVFGIYCTYVYQMLTKNSFATILTLHIPIKNVPSKMFTINIIKACPNTLVHELSFDVLCPLWGQYATSSLTLMTLLCFAHGQYLWFIFRPCNLINFHIWPVSPSSIFSMW